MLLADCRRRSDGDLGQACMPDLMAVFRLEGMDPMDLLEGRCGADAPEFKKLEKTKFFWNKVETLYLSKLLCSRANLMLEAANLPVPKLSERLYAGLGTTALERAHQWADQSA